MQFSLEVLNNFLGHNPIEIDTDSEEGKAKIAELFMKMLKSGTAIFLERANETYRVTGFDAATDSLKVMVPIPVKALPPATVEAEVIGAPRQLAEGISICACTRCTCSNEVQPTSRTGMCSYCQQGRHGVKQKPVRERKRRFVHAKPRPHRGDRVSAVAPRAGG